MASAERNLMKRALSEAQTAVDIGAARARVRALRNEAAPPAPDVPGMTPVGDHPYGTVSPTGPMPSNMLDPNESWIIHHESRGKTTAKNPRSTAFGLGQLLKGNREKYGKMLGIDPNTTDFGDQLQLFRTYIKERYGTAEKAKAFWEQHGWY